MTQWSNHDTRIRTIWDTWGKRCDKLIVSSTANDPSINAIDIQATLGYWGLWDKLGATLQYLLEHYRHEGYDWIFKADDDTYVILENLRAFLANHPEEEEEEEIEDVKGRDGSSKGRIRTIQNKNNLTGTIVQHDNDTSGNGNNDPPPLIYGRIMTLPTLSILKDDWGWFTNVLGPNQVDKRFGKKLYAKFNATSTPFSYAHGGPGYIMNWKYIEVLMDIIQHDKTTATHSDTLHGHIGEDTANALTMLYHYNITPSSTRDVLSGLERMHPESPTVMYDNPSWLVEKQLHIDHIGTGVACCAPDSISYHHVTPEEMRLIDLQLYVCPHVV
jgi:hypothetical protein